jgi:hypothetical protein
MIRESERARVKMGRERMKEMDYIRHKELTVLRNRNNQNINILQKHTHKRHAITRDKE